MTTVSPPSLVNLASKSLVTVTEYANKEVFVSDLPSLACRVGLDEAVVAEFARDVAAGSELDLAAVYVKADRLRKEDDQSRKYLAILYFLFLYLQEPLQPVLRGKVIFHLITMYERGQTLLLSFLIRYALLENHYKFDNVAAIVLGVDQIVQEEEYTSIWIQNVLKRIYHVAPEISFRQQDQVRQFFDYVIDVILGWRDVNALIVINFGQQTELVTPLFYALYLNNKPLVQALLDLGADPKVLDKSGNSILSALRSDDVGLLISLIDAGAPLNTVSVNGLTILHHCIEANLVNCLLYLMNNHAEKLAFGGVTIPILFYSLVQADVEVDLLTALLAWMREEDLGDSFVTPWQPSAAALECMEQKEAVKLAFSRASTPLHIAAQMGSFNALKALVAAIPDGFLEEALKARDSEGYTPLLWAALRGRIDVLVFLLGKGADIFAKVTSDERFKRRNVFQLLIISDSREALAALCATDMVSDADKKRLLEDKEIGLDTLHWVIEHGNFWALDAILGLGVDVNRRVGIRGRDCKSALERILDKYATDQAGVDDGVRKLLAAGADPEPIVSEYMANKTLHGARKDGLVAVFKHTPDVDYFGNNLELVRTLIANGKLMQITMLLEYGANPDTLDVEGVPLVVRILPNADAWERDDSLLGIEAAASASGGGRRRGGKSRRRRGGAGAVASELSAEDRRNLGRYLRYCSWLDRLVGMIFKFNAAIGLFLEHGVDIARAQHLYEAKVQEYIDFCHTMRAAIGEFVAAHAGDPRMAKLRDALQYNARGVDNFTAAVGLLEDMQSVLRDVSMGREVEDDGVAAFDALCSRLPVEDQTAAVAEVAEPEPVINVNLPDGSGFNVVHRMCVSPQSWPELAEIFAQDRAEHMPARQQRKFPLDILFNFLYETARGDVGSYVTMLNRFKVLFSGKIERFINYSRSLLPLYSAATELEKLFLILQAKIIVVQQEIERGEGDVAQMQIWLQWLQDVKKYLLSLDRLISAKIAEKIAVSVQPLALIFAKERRKFRAANATLLYSSVNVILATDDMAKVRVDLSLLVNLAMRGADYESRIIAFHLLQRTMRGAQMHAKAEVLAVLVDVLEIVIKEQEGVHDFSALCFGAEENLTVDLVHLLAQTALVLNDFEPVVRVGIVLAQHQSFKARHAILHFVKDIVEKEGAGYGLLADRLEWLDILKMICLNPRDCNADDLSDAVWCIPFFLERHVELSFTFLEQVVLDLESLWKNNKIVKNICHFINWKWNFLVKHCAEAELQVLFKRRLLKVLARARVDADEYGHHETVENIDAVVEKINTKWPASVRCERASRAEAVVVPSVVDAAEGGAEEDCVREEGEEEMDEEEVVDGVLVVGVVAPVVAVEGDDGGDWREVVRGRRAREKRRRQLEQYKSQRSELVAGLQQVREIVSCPEVTFLHVEHALTVCAAVIRRAQELETENPTVGAVLQDGLATRQTLGEMESNAWRDGNLGFFTKVASGDAQKVLLKLFRHVFTAERPEHWIGELLTMFQGRSCLYGGALSDIYSNYLVTPGLNPMSRNYNFLVVGDPGAILEQLLSFRGFRLVADMHMAHGAWYIRGQITLASGVGREVEFRVLTPCADKAPDMLLHEDLRNRDLASATAAVAYSDEGKLILLDALGELRAFTSLRDGVVATVQTPAENFSGINGPLRWWRVVADLARSDRMIMHEDLRACCVERAEHPLAIEDRVTVLGKDLYHTVVNTLFSARGARAYRIALDHDIWRVYFHSVRVEVEDVEVFYKLVEMLTDKEHAVHANILGVLESAPERGNLDNFAQLTEVVVAALAQELDARDGWAVADSVWHAVVCPPMPLQEQYAFCRSAVVASLVV